MREKSKNQHLKRLESLPHHAASLLGVIALAAVLLGVTPASAQFEDAARTVNKRGTTAAEFLSIPVGARATGMGSALTALADDPTAIYWNPGGLANMQGSGIAFEYADWLVGVDINFIALAVNTSAGAVGISITSMRTPEMEVTTLENQNGTGETFDASSYAFGVTYSRRLTDRFSIGGTAKLISERIWHSNASGAALDIGTMFVTPFRGIRLGASIANFGSKMSINGDDLLIVADIDPNNEGNNESNRAYLKTDRFDLPLTMRIGLAGEVFESDQARVTLAVDALNPNNSEQYVNLGAEVALLGELLMLRGGYSELFLDENLRGFTAGAGLRYRFGSLRFSADYAFEAQEYFSGVNRITVILNF
jgi:hypothetical protein